MSIHVKEMSESDQSMTLSILSFSAFIKFLANWYSSKHADSKGLGPLTVFIGETLLLLYMRWQPGEL